MLIGRIEIVKDGKKLSKQIPPEGITIGRGQEADVIVSDTAVSKLHCKIFSQGNQFFLQDLKSRNFTFCNGEKVSGTIPLNNRDIIKIGRVEIIFCLGEKEKTQDLEIDSFEKNKKEVVLKPKEEESKASFENDSSSSEEAMVAIGNGNFPAHLMKSSEEFLFVRITLSLPGNKVTPGKIHECLLLRERNPQMSLKDILLRKHYITEHDIRIIERIMGNIIVEEKSSTTMKLDEAEIEEVVAENSPSNSEQNFQVDQEDRLFVKVALAKRFITEEQIRSCALLQRKYATQGQSVKLFDLLENENCLKSAEATNVRQLVKGKEIPYRIDGYEMISLIGAGGMGTIYKARQISMDRLVAIKILAREHHNNSQINELFLKEARAVARLNHENIVAGFDFGEANGVSFFVMEFVDGPSLLEELKNNKGSLSTEQTLSIITQVTKALEHACMKELIHRDIKPENILLTKDGTVKLCDLGLAKSTDQEQDTQKKRRFGTPAYMSPERIRSEANVDIRGDIYSLGVAFYRTIFGRLPFTGSTREILAKHLTEPVRFPKEGMEKNKVPVSRIILKMMAKDPANRYQSPTQLIEDLHKVQQTLKSSPEESSQGAAQSVSAPPKIARKKRRIQALRRKRWR